VLLHLGNVAALFFLVHRLSGAAAVAGGTALLFSVHPINSEAVAWVACLPELAYALFGLLALLAQAASWTAPDSRRGWLRAASLTSFVLALLSKETAVVLLLLVLVLEGWVRPRVAPGTSRSLDRALRPFFPFLLATAAYLGLRLAVLGGIAPRGGRGLSALEAAASAPGLLLSYLAQLAAPFRLVAYRLFEPVGSVLDPRFLASSAGVALVGVALLALLRRRSNLGFAASLAVLPLLPVLYVPAVGLNVFAERYAYLPSAGFCWLVAGSLAALAAWPMAVLGGNWLERQGRLEESLAVYERGLAVTPGEPLLEAAAVNARFRLRRIGADEAVRSYRRLAEIHPAGYEILYNQGDAALKAGSPAEAEEAFRKAVGINPNDPRGHQGLALALVAQGRIPDWGEAETAGRRFDEGPEDRVVRAVAQMEQGLLDQAEESLQEAIRLDPGSNAAFLSLAVLESRRGDEERAAEHARRAIVLRPDSAPAHQQLGVSALRLGRIEEARRAFERALALDPGFEKARENLGRLERIAGPAPP
jgi:tetratricopeptide (TPR) repeat protein